MSNKLTQERLKQLLHYEPESGVFTWRVKKCRAEAGSVAGTPHNAGYTTLKIDGVKYLRHRCVWLYEYGRWPVEEIDHMDGNRGNDRLSNLRECTSSENKQNLAERTRRKAGTLLGAILTRGRWKAQIRSQGVVHCIGHYDTEDQAHHAYLLAKRQIHKFQPTPRKP